MNEPELIAELARRTGVSDETARAILNALLDIVREGGVSEDILLSPGLARVPAPATIPAIASGGRMPITNHADTAAVDDLIDRARRHNLGLEFLISGYLGSVAAEFGTHAFTVEAARQRLRNGRKGSPDDLDS